jgi:CRISPR-associated exonuclease Cas4
LNIAPSIYNAFNICPRQAWLLSRQLTADQQNTYLDIGRLISEESFSREKKEIYIPDLAAKIDYVKKRDGEFFVAEVKKSSATMQSGIMQLKYYLYLLDKKGIQAKGLIKIPKEKKAWKLS